MDYPEDPDWGTDHNPILGYEIVEGGNVSMKSRYNKNYLLFNLFWISIRKAPRIKFRKRKVEIRRISL